MLPPPTSVLSLSRNSASVLVESSPLLSLSCSRSTISVSLLLSPNCGGSTSKVLDVKISLLSPSAAATERLRLCISNVAWLAISRRTAKGSKTNIIVIITHLTASSSISLSVSPYINSARYFIGPTSASNFLYSACRAYFSSVKLSILLLNSTIFCCCAFTNASTFWSLPTVRLLRNLCIRSLLAAICVSAPALRSFIVCLAALILISSA